MCQELHKISEGSVPVQRRDITDNEGQEEVIGYDLDALGAIQGDDDLAASDGPAVRR